MKRLLAAAIGLLVAATVLAWPAGASVPATLDAKNRQVKTFTLSYKRMCPSCNGNTYNPKTKFASATGKVHFDVESFRIDDENNKYDFYMIDVTASWKKTKGDEDWGWMDIALKSSGKTKVISSSYTLGRTAKNKTTCKTYPINLGVSYMGISAGTTVAKVRVCNPGSKVSSKSIKNGRRYHVTGLSGFSSLVMQRYVRVKNGTHPKFRVSASTNSESFQCGTWDSQYHCWIGRYMHSGGVTIGTTKQKK